jgi:hypothetical protein
MLDFREDLSIFFNLSEFAETIVYTASGGSPVNVTAVVIRNIILEEPYVRGGNTARSEIYVKKSEVDNPKFGDTFTFDQQTWELDPIRGVMYNDEDDDIFKIGLERNLS